MESLRQYILSVICVALICGILSGIVPDGSKKNVFRLLCGIILAFTVLRPLTRLKIEDLTEFLTFDTYEASEAAAAGKAQAEKAMADIIKSRCESYILDKAAELHAAIQVEIRVSSGQPPLPVEATIRGTASPYARRQIESIIEKDLGIPKEDLQWIG